MDHEEDPHGGIAPESVQVPQYAKVPQQRDQVPIEGEGNDVYWFPQT